jgi:tetratricopeptide (TPR) repeat protein
MHVGVLVLVHEPLASEAAHLADDREQRLALRRQLVLDARRRLGVAPADEDRLLLEDAEPLGERPRTYPRAGALELGEAARALREVVDEDGRPLRADDVCGTRDRALAVVHRAHGSHDRIVLDASNAAPPRSGVHPRNRGADDLGMSEAIGRRLLRLRRERGLSQRDVSGPGVSYTYISRIEAGQRQPSVKALRTIALRLGVTPEYLETGKDLPPAEDRELRIGDAELQLRLADADRAEETLRAVLAEAEAVGDTAVAARARVALAVAADRQGRHHEVVAVLEDVVELARPSVGEQPDVYGLLGRAYAALGETPQAIAFFTRCVAELRAADPVDPIVFVRFATHLASTLVEAGDAAGAHRALAEALRRADGVTDRHTLVRLYWSLGRIYAVAGPTGRALEYVRRAIALLEATEDTFHLARAHQLAASILLDQESAAPARRHLERAENLLGPEAEREDVGFLKTEQARLQLQLGDPGAARARALEALAVLEGGAAVAGGHAWRTLADVFHDLGESELVERAYLVALAKLAEQGAGRHVAETYRAFGKFLRASGREHEALDAFEQAADLAVAGSAAPAVPAA